MKKSVKTKGAVLLIAASISLVSMSFRPAPNENSMVKSTKTTKHLTTVASSFTKPEKTGDVALAAAAVVVVWVADSSWTLVLLDGENHERGINAQENAEFEKKMIDVKQHQLDTKK